MVVVVDDLQAIMGGLKAGGNMSKLALAGLQPSSGSPRGGPPPVDPLAGPFRQGINILNSLAQALQRQGDQARSVDLQDMSVKLQRLSIDRQNDIAKAGISEQQSDNGNSMPGTFPNVNAGGTL